MNCAAAFFKALDFSDMLATARLLSATHTGEPGAVGLGLDLGLDLDAALGAAAGEGGTLTERRERRQAPLLLLISRLISLTRVSVSMLAASVSAPAAPLFPPPPPQRVDWVLSGNTSEPNSEYLPPMDSRRLRLAAVCLVSATGIEAGRLDGGGAECARC